MTDQKLFSRGAVPAMSAMCISAVLLTGCEYAHPPGTPEKATASASASAAPSPAVAGSLNGKTGLNKFFLATEYTCVEGDTWETVARAFGIKTDILKTFNKSAVLKAGTVIDVRGKEVPQLGAGGQFVPNPDGTGTYTVQAEDTLSGISSRFGVPGYALRGANLSLRGTGAELTADPGQQLTIPGTF